MKNIIATAIALTIATSASASAIIGTKTVTWNGKTASDLHASGACNFKEYKNGKMTFDGTDTWETTQNAVVVLKVKPSNTGLKNVKVEPGTHLMRGTSEVSTVSVNYKPESTVSVKNGSGYVAKVNTNSITVDNLNPVQGRTKISFTIGGEAKMTNLSVDAELLLENSTDYTIDHTVTCLQ